MSNMSFSDMVKVKSPCNESWDQMQGTDKMRFCSHCTKHVNNLSEMTRKEAMILVRSSNGNICVRYIANPVTKRPVFADQIYQITRRAPGIAAGVMTASIALSTQAFAQDNSMPITTTPPVVTVSPSSTPNVVTPTTVEIPPVDGPIMLMGAIAIPSRRPAFKNALSLAVQSYDIEAVRDLISKGALVNAKEDDRSTPLFVAVDTGNLEMVEMLLNAGASINLRDSDKKTPLMEIGWTASPELVEMLVRHRAKLNLSDNDGNTAIILAATRANIETLRALVDAGADVTLANKAGQTALMNAVGTDNIDTVKLFILAGSDVNAKNKEGETVWDLTYNDEIKALLESYGAVPTKEDPEQLEDK